MRSEHWMYRCALFEEENSTLPRNGIIFLGDSITEEFIFSRHLRDYQIINRGISGDTIDGVIERLKVSVFNLNPSILYLLIGVNDIGSGFGTEIIQSNFYQLISSIEENLPQSRLVIQSILPCSTEWGNSTVDQIKIINNFLELTCRNMSIQYLNLYDSFLDINGYLKEEFTRDGLHLNSNGYSHWAKILEESLQPETDNA